MTTALASLVPMVRAYAPTAPAMLVEQALLEAARTLCREAEVLRDTISLTTTPGTAAYTLTMPPGVELVDIASALYAGDMLIPSAPNTMDQLATQTVSVSDAPVRFARTDLTSITLYPVPMLAEPLVIRYSWQPAVTVSGLDPRLTTLYDTVLRAGALARILRIPDRDWTDLKSGLVYDAEFKLAIREASFRAATGSLRRTPRAVRYGGF